MKSLPFLFLSALAAYFLGVPSIRAAEEGGVAKEKGEWLEPFAHDYYWESFTVTKEAPLSPDGRFKLKKVLRNGNVELLLQSGGRDAGKIVIKPMPSKPKSGERPPSLVVDQSDAKKQSAVLKELKMR